MVYAVSILPLCHTVVFVTRMEKFIRHRCCNSQLLEDKLKRGLISTGQYVGDDDSGRETDENDMLALGQADENVMDLTLKVTTIGRFYFRKVVEPNEKSKSILFCT